MDNQHLFSRLKYRLGKMVIKGLPHQILLLVIVVISFLCAVALLVSLFSQVGFAEALWKSFMDILDPGNLSGENSKTWRIILPLTIVTFIGIFIWSALVAILNEGLKNWLNEIRNSKVKIIESRHNIILGYSPYLNPILLEYIKSGIVKTVIIQSEEARTKLERELFFLKKKALDMGFKNKMEVIVREGEVLDLDNLALLNIAQANSLIILHESDEYKIKIILAVKKIINQSQVIHREPFEISLLISTSFYKPLLKTLEEDKKIKINVIYKKNLLINLLASSTLYPGIANIVEDLFSYGGYAFSLDEEKKHAAKNFIESAEKSIAKGELAIGYFKADRKHYFLGTQNNDEFNISTDTIVYLKKEKLELHNQENHEKPKLRKKVEHKNILVISDDSFLADLEKELNHHLRHSRRHIIKVNIHNLYNKENVKDVLEKILAKNDLSDIVLTSSLDNKYDDFLMNILIYLRALTKEKYKNIHILTKLNLSQNKDLIADDTIRDFIISGVLFGNLLAQISLCSVFLPLYCNLLSSGNEDLIITEFSNQFTRGTKLTFREAYFSLLHKNIILLGLICDDTIYLIPDQNTDLNDAHSLILIQNTSL